jgi:S-DNA-T family DNA segregation ATPase FtsK/SpoIIIE
VADEEQARSEAALAIPDDTVRDEPPTGPAVYADVTPPGERRPVLPYWMRGRQQFREAVRIRSGYWWYLLRLHGLRLPVYAVLTVFWGTAGTGWLLFLWLRWWLMPVPAEMQVQALQGHWRDWKTLHTTHKQDTKTRAKISLAVVIVAGFGFDLAWQYGAHWVLTAAPFVVLVISAWLGRPEGVKIVTPAIVPSQYERLTQDVIVRALGSLGISKIDQWLREGREIVFPHPVRQDGMGWRAEVDLPFGATATMVMERREQFASGLRRPLGAVWPEPITREHTGRLEVWVGQHDVSDAPAPPWPLLKSGQADVFKPMPFGVDVRGRRVRAPLIYHAWLIGSIPRQGKTATMREMACWAAMDPLCEEWIHELKGTGDLDPLEPLCTRFISGLLDEHMAYAAESLRKLRTECEKRSELIRSLDSKLCPEKRVTREIAEKIRRLRPIVCFIDEMQNLFLSPYRKQAETDAQFVMKVGPAMGIALVLATQRPDKESCPKGISANASIRFCLHVTGQVENDMILGTSAYQNGIRATLFRPETDAGLGYLKGATPAPVVCRPHFLDLPATELVVARAMVLRERAGTLPVQASADPERDVLADVLAVFGDDSGLHWEVLAERLADRWPDRWAGAAKDAVSAQCRELGVPPGVDVRYPKDRTGKVLKGCYRDQVAEVASRNTAGQAVGV